MGNSTTVSQIESGFRKAGLALYVIGTLFPLFGGAAIASGQSYYYSPPIGWLLLFAAAVILILEIDRWRKILPVLLAFAAFNGAVAVFSGHLTNKPGIPIPRFDALALTVFFGASAALSQKLVRLNPNPVMRACLMMFVICSLWASLSKTVSFPALGIGFSGLLIAWAYSRGRRSRGDHERSSLA
jgi:fucose 4-O-acetylase-like acetyltransferase